MTNPETALRSGHVSSIKKAKNYSKEKGTILAWEASLNDDSVSCIAEVVIAASDEPHIEHKNCQVGTRRAENEDMIAREVEYVVKHLVAKVAKELSIMEAELLEDILHTSFHDVQICILSVSYNVFEQVTLNQLGK